VWTSVIVMFFMSLAKYEYELAEGGVAKGGPGCQEFQSHLGKDAKTKLRVSCLALCTLPSL
jgi:hypothetical protein